MATLLGGLKDILKAPPKQQPETKVPLFRPLSREELQARIAKYTTDMPIELEKSKQKLAELIARRGGKCSLYGYKFIRIDSELYYKAKDEYTLVFDRIEDEGKCAVWIAPEDYPKAQQKGWQMQVLIEDGQDVADEKLEFLIDSTSRQIAALEYLISNKLPYTMMAATPENIQRRAEEEAVAQQERNKRCAEIKAKRLQQK